MEKIIYNDGSFSYTYRQGDYVKLINPQKKGFVSNDVGEWGRVYLDDKADRERGHTSCISFITIATAGISTKQDSFQQRLTGVPVWDVAPISDELQEAITQAEELPIVKDMVKCVYFANGRYGVNYKPINTEIGDTFHYDHGAGIHRNNDATVIFISR